MITDSQIKQFLGSEWDEYFNHLSDNEFPKCADKGTCMLFEFEDYIQAMTYSDMFLAISENAPEGFNADDFDAYDYKLIKLSCYKGTDTMINLLNKVKETYND